MADEWTEHAREEEMRQLTARVATLEEESWETIDKINELVNAVNVLIDSVRVLIRRPR